MAKSFVLATKLGFQARYVKCIIPRFRTICGFTPQETEPFRTNLLYSGVNSVDQFLEHRSAYLNIGKASIAYALIQKENRTKLFRYEKNWLRDLYARINTSVAGLKSSKLSIITFNYDRCIEFFLHTAIRNSHDVDDDTAGDILANIPIIHLHGRLGFLPWQRATDADKRRFHFEPEPRCINASVRNIKIIHEASQGSDEDFNQAKTLLKDADRILFLGFGYNQTNLNRLELKELQNKKIFGMCMGMGNQEKRRIGDAFANPNSRIDLVDGNCQHFIREYMM